MKNNHEVFRIITLITQIGITMLTSVFLCGAIGYFIDKKFDTNFLIFFIIIGIAGGYKAVYNLIKQYIHIDKEDEGEPDDDISNKM